MLTTPTRIGYGQRAELCSHPLSRILFRLMEEKQTNLAVGLDVTSKKELLALAEAVGPEICVLKTHIDIVDDFDEDLVRQLQALSQRFQFLLFEDRKFADIGHTARYQYLRGPFRIADWAHLTNAHPLPGPGLIEGLREIGQPRDRGLLLLAQMSSRGNLIDQRYLDATVAMAREHHDFVMGFISQGKVCDTPTFLHFTPGIRLEPGQDGLGQQWNTPQTAIETMGTDVIIVNRGVTQSKNPKEAAQRYREAGWESYHRSLGQC